MGVGYSLLFKYEGNTDACCGSSWNSKRKGDLKGKWMNRFLKLSECCDDMVDVMLQSLWINKIIN